MLRWYGLEDGRLWGLQEGVEVEDGAVFAYEFPAELAVAAKSDGAFHVSFHGDVDVFNVDAFFAQSHDRETHHDLGAAGHGDSIERVETGAGYKSGDDADVAPPGVIAAVHGYFDFEVESGAPLFEFVSEEDIGGGSGAIEQDYSAIFFPLLFNQCIDQTIRFSIIAATPNPPPQQELKQPYLPPFLISSLIVKMQMREPDAPLG